MPLFDLIPNIPPLGELYFFYGLTFFILAASILLKRTKSSNLKISRSLWLLAAFGLIHGIHEWLELYLILHTQSLPTYKLILIKKIAIFFVTSSFLFLLAFGVKLIFLLNSNYQKRLKDIRAIIFIAAGTLLIWIMVIRDNQFIGLTERSVRHIFGFMGGLVTAYGLIRHSKQLLNISVSVSRKLYYAGITFAFYSIFVGLFSSRKLLPYIGVRVEVFRAISAVFITYFIVKALDIFDIENMRSLEQQVKRLEQSEKLASLGQLAAGVAHEVNNPLTNISLNIQMIKDSLKGISYPETIKGKLNAMEKNIDKVSSIAKELLQFSRNTEPDIRPVNINNLIKGALILMQYKFRDITINQELSDVPDIIGDPVKLEQVFINILDNSIEAMTADDIICIESSYNDGWIKIRIADSGVGIPQKNLSRVFDPFFTTKDVGKGTGLGLSICYGIITQHGGNIDIKSVQGEGTTVIIKLPVAVEKMENYKNG